MQEPTSVERIEAATRDEMRDTATSLSGKMDAIGKGITDAWEQAKDAVSDTADAAKSTVETTVHAVQDAVQETRNAVQHAVQDTGRAIGRAFDLREQVRRQPWMACGGAMCLGVFLGYLTAPRR